MKILPFWKMWYFTREQRLGIIALSVIMIVIILVNGPVSRYIVNRQEAELGAENKAAWEKLNVQIQHSRELAQKQKPAEPFNSSGQTSKKVSASQERKTRSMIVLEINTAGREDWQRLRGIGPVLSERIVKYRDRLGGFSRVEQLREVYGISDSLYQSVKAGLKLDPTSAVRRYSVNTASLEELEKHPYISKTLAKQIVGYRSKVKSFETMEELQKLYAMNDTLYNKLLPYLTIY